VDVHRLAPQDSVAAVIRQPAHGGVCCHGAVDDGQVQEVNLALSDTCAGGLLRTAQQALGVPDVWPQTHTRTPAVLCSQEARGKGGAGRQTGRH